MKTKIHVNQHIIKKNKKNGTNDCPLTVKSSLGNIKTALVSLLGPSRVVYSPDKPLPCGATCWVETDSEVVTNLDAKFVGLAPDIQANFFFDGIGYQMDILSQGKMMGSECRDFSGKTYPKKLREEVVKKLLELVADLRENH